MMALKDGIKVRVSDGNGGVTHLKLMPHQFTIISSIAGVIVALGIIISLAGGARDRWNQIPANTKAITLLKKQGIETRVCTEGNTLILKGILQKVDPQGAPALIAQMEKTQELMKKELENLEMGGMTERSK